MGFGECQGKQAKLNEPKGWKARPDKRTGAQEMTKSTKAESLTAFKGFEKDMKCRGFQFVGGETYEHKGVVKHCESGFHSCESPLDVFGYYPPSDSRFAVVTASGEISKEQGGDTKIASAKLTVDVELTLPEFVSKAVEWITKRIDATIEQAVVTGNYSAATNTGYRSAATNTGYQSAASVTGEASVAIATGSYGKAKASASGAIVFVFRDDEGNLINIRASKVGDNGIKPDVFYELNDSGEFVEAA